MGTIAVFALGIVVGAVGLLVLQHPGILRLVADVDRRPIRELTPLPTGLAQSVQVVPHGAKSGY